MDHSRKRIERTSADESIDPRQRRPQTCTRSPRAPRFLFLLLCLSGWTVSSLATAEATVVSSDRPWRLSTHGDLGAAKELGREHGGGVALGIGLHHQLSRPSRAVGGDLSYFALGERKGPVYDSVTMKSRQEPLHYSAVSLVGHVSQFFRLDPGANGYVAAGGGLYTITARRSFGGSGTAKDNDSAKLGILGGCGVVFHSAGSGKAVGIDAKLHFIRTDEPMCVLTVLARVWL